MLRTELRSFMKTRRRILPCLLALSLVALPATVAGAKPFSGKSKQKLRVSLSNQNKNRIRVFRYQATMNCSDGTSFTDGVVSDEVRVRHSGRFSDSFKDDKGAFITKITGRIKGKRASGKLRVRERYGDVPDANGFTPLDPKGSVSCDSGTVRWTAKSK
jgi:hypothetical protein